MITNIKKKRNQIYIVIFAIILLITASVGAVFYLVNIKNNSEPSDLNTDNQSIQSTVDVKDEVPEKPKNKISIAAMGDMLAHDTIIANAKTTDGYDFGKYFNNISFIYKLSDVVFCNQEGLSSGESYGISGYPSFNAPKQFSYGLQSGAGCNVINLANNHMGDKGAAATNATIDVWSQLKPLAVSGANKSIEDQKRVSYAEINGVKLGFVSFADFNNNNSIPAYSINNYHDESLVRQLITTARANADVVMVSMHWGVEDSNIVSSNQISEVNLLSSLGVDVIIGTGPHVLQKAQLISRSDGGKTLVWYSLGNMLSSQLYIKQLIGGIAQFDITKAADNKLTIDNISFTPTYMHYEWTASQSANGDLLARKNAMIYPLNDAADPLSRSLFNTTVDAQKQYVIDTLGSEVTVK